MNTKGHIWNVRAIVFTRFPVPGHAKTRLIPTLGAEGAAELQRRMTEFTVAQIHRTGMNMEIRFTGGTKSQIREWLGPDGHYTLQGGGDLGTRMERAFEEAFTDGAEKVIVVGCDCPDNRAENMMNAIKTLDDTPCVIGPATDGGYYLIGLSEPRPELFRNVDWGTETVFRQTVEKLDDYALLPERNDVDESNDIPLKISVIIPAMNEEDHIGSTVKAVLNGFNTEPIVVDGGSSDRTRDIAQRTGATLLVNSPGRTLQMNEGAKQATGDILLFLHADSELPLAWDYHIRQVMNESRVSLGYFRFAIKGSFSGQRWIELGTNLRARLLKRPYGDQGLFIRRSDFFELGGFPEVPILEDIFLVKRAKQLGRLRCTHTDLSTSGRRWIKYGAIRTTLINQAILLAACFGADLDPLKEAYRHVKNPWFALLRHAKRKGKR